MINKLEKELSNLPKDFIVLTLLPATHFEEINLHLLKSLIKKGNGSYITVNKPYKSLVTLFQENDIDINKIHFIDCITEELREKGVAKNCIFIDSPSSLTRISIALDPLFKKEDHEFVFLDSLDTLMLYNSKEAIIKFMHFLTGKMRMHKLSGVILALHEETNNEMLDELSQFCDKVIDLSKKSKK